MIRQHHRLSGHEQTPRNSGGQRSLECCSSWGRKEVETTQQLNNKQSNLQNPPKEGTRSVKWVHSWKRSETAPESSLGWLVKVFLSPECVFRSFSCVRFFWTPWTISCQALLSMGFFRQEYWSGLPFLSPEDLPDPRIELASLHLLHWQMGSLALAPPGKPFPSQSQEVKTGGSDFLKWEESNAIF